MTAEEDMGETSLINVSGIYWTACNKGKIIKKGEEFTITGLEGTKLIVKLKEN
jgi:membrane protein implicated in regulation of membrane protease activity